MDGNRLFQLSFPICACSREPICGCHQYLAYWAPSASEASSLSLLRASPWWKQGFWCSWENRTGVAEEVASSKHFTEGLGSRRGTPAGPHGVWVNRHQLAPGTGSWG